MRHSRQSSSVPFGFRESACDSLSQAHRRMLCMQCIHIFSYSSEEDTFEMDSRSFSALLTCPKEYICVKVIPHFLNSIAKHQPSSKTISTDISFVDRLIHSNVCTSYISLNSTMFNPNKTRVRFNSIKVFNYDPGIKKLKSIKRSVLRFEYGRIVTMNFKI